MFLARAIPAFTSQLLNGLTTGLDARLEAACGIGAHRIKVSG